jgi:uncharacterized Zn-finger protein
MLNEGQTQTMPPVPPPAPTTVETPEVILVSEHRVKCDGGGGALGHPRVYLEMGEAHFVECGYCDRRFVLAGHEQREDERLAPGAYDPGDTPEA